ncbi:phage major capsid protein, P2 family [Marinobacterium stanieri]|uniref:Phage major capsid protein, P2 family n=1 Tax=Marinobacterium stanieri TaxID=49186 RepID=A0A1N6Q256_9GAMM|nr:phage major capsid protein, P2 family [Marinobacterium stanieri]SIQ10615.1 phage major capsid protein, P2 family [Marinobacterium stanieri]
MRNETRALYNAYLAQIGSLNKVEDPSVKFNVLPSVQQTLETKIQESSEFLSRINIIPVREMQGDKLGLGIGNPIASNTDTSNKDRQTKDPTNLDERGYLCRKNNSDTHITYAKLDMWAKFPDFQTRIRDAILRRQALDRITIGFNGASYSADSDIATNPLLQDVNIGWFQKYRDEAAERVLSEVVDASGKINVYAGGDYENLDALVFDAVNNLIEPWYREDTELVAIMGRDLLADKYFPIVNQNHAPTETLAADLVISQKRVGGLPAVRAPFVPAGAMMITRLDNLSIYFQEEARRRHLMDNPKRDRIENYESSNDAYVVEDYGLGCLIENIETVNPAP